MTDHKLTPREPALYWYFASLDRKLRYGDARIAKVGITHEVTEQPRLCERGLHASRNPLDALRLGGGPVAFRVRLGGKVVHGDSKSCGQRRTYVDGGEDMTPTLVEFACCVAEAALLLADVTDNHPWHCIEATRAYMRGDIELATLMAVRDTSAVAVPDVAYVADVAGDTVYAVAVAASVYAAYADADAAKNEINSVLHDMLLEAMP